MNKKTFIAKLLWFLKSYIWLAPLIAIIDQVTKLVAEHHRPNNVVVIKNFFYIDYAKNPGIAFSMGTEYTILWAFFSLAAGIAMCYYLAKKYHTFNILNRLSLILMIGGCFGNMIDRMFYDGVIDFLKFKFGNYVFPTFNIADSSLVIGVIALLIYMTFEEKFNAYFAKQKQKKELEGNQHD